MARKAKTTQEVAQEVGEAIMANPDNPVDAMAGAIERIGQPAIAGAVATVSVNGGPEHVLPELPDLEHVLTEPDQPLVWRQVSLERELPVALTDAELLETASALAARYAELDKANEALRVARDVFKQNAAYLEGDIRRLARTLREKTEDRKVTCTEIHDFEAHQVFVTRDDTGEEISRRDMNPAEHQATLPLEELTDEAIEAAINGEDYAPEFEDDSEAIAAAEAELAAEQNPDGDPFA